MPVHHPRGHHRGQSVVIERPTEPSPLGHWFDPDAVATVVPDGALPEVLHAVPLATPWHEPPTDDGGWAQVDGQCLDLEEPPLTPLPGLGVSAGVAIVESDGRIWLAHPTNQYAGYNATFPKGRCDPGLGLQATAIKEGWEETGLRSRITGFLGDFKRTTTVMRLYLAERIGGSPAAMGWETQAVSLAPLSALPDLLNGPLDWPVMHALQAHLGRGN